MRKLLLVITMCLIPASVFATEKINDENIKANFARIIQMNNYVCNSCNVAYFLGQEHRGLAFRIHCDDNSLAYKITQTPNKEFIVKPL